MTDTPVDPIAELQREVASLRAERDMYKAITETRVVREDRDSRDASNWRMLKNLLAGQMS